MLKLIACRDLIDQKSVRKTGTKKDVYSENMMEKKEKMNTLYEYYVHPQFSVVMCAKHVHIHCSVVFLCYAIEVRQNNIVVGGWRV